jgi:hypothetical protein
MQKEYVNKFTWGGDIDILYVNAMAKNTISGKEALKVLFQWILVTIKSTKDKPFEEYSYVLDYNKKGQPLYFSTKYSHFVPDIIWCMRKLKLVDEIIYYLEWDNMVQKKFAAKISGQNYINEETDYLAFLWRMQNVFYEIVLEELPEEFRYLIDESKNKTYDNYWDVRIPPMSDGTLTSRIAEINLQGSIEGFSKKNPAIQFQDISFTLRATAAGSFYGLDITGTEEHSLRIKLFTQIRLAQKNVRPAFIFEKEVK